MLCCNGSKRASELDELRVYLCRPQRICSHLWQLQIRIRRTFKILIVYAVVQMRAYAEERYKVYLGGSS